MMFNSSSSPSAEGGVRSSRRAANDSGVLCRAPGPHRAPRAEQRRDRGSSVTPPFACDATNRVTHPCPPRRRCSAGSMQAASQPPPPPKKKKSGAPALARPPARSSGATPRSPPSARGRTASPRTRGGAVWLRPIHTGPWRGGGGRGGGARTPSRAAMSARSGHSRLATHGCPRIFFSRSFRCLLFYMASARLRSFFGKRPSMGHPPFSRARSAACSPPRPVTLQSVV